jgi:hypothetical protein
MTLAQFKVMSERETLEKIAYLIDHPPVGSVVMTITPKAAQAILDKYNVHNRPIKSRKITEYAADMKDVCWKLTGDSMKFSDRGLLRDGQNRLLACVKANKPFTTHVVFGIEDESFLWLDRGKPRNGSDALAIMDIANHNDVAAMVRYLEMLNQDRMKDRLTLTPQETVLAFGKYDRERIEAAMVVARRVYSVDRTPRSVAAALYYEFSRRNQPVADEFFEAWCTNALPSRMKSLRKAKDHIARLYEASNGRVHDTVRAAIWVLAWNCAISRRRGTAPTLRWQPQDVFPQIKG